MITCLMWEEQTAKAPLSSQTTKVAQRFAAKVCPAKRGDLDPPRLDFMSELQWILAVTGLQSKLVLSQQKVFFEAKTQVHWERAGKTM